MIIYWKRDKQDVHFYCGETPPKEINGPGWDDVPYECFAELPKDFVQHEYVFHFKGDVTLLEPKEWNKNIDSPFCMNDIARRVVPFLIVLPTKLTKNRQPLYTGKSPVNLPGIGDEDPILEPLFSDWNLSDDEHVCKLYLGDEVPITDIELMNYVDMFVKIR